MTRVKTVSRFFSDCKSVYKVLIDFKTRQRNIENKKGEADGNIKKKIRLRSMKIWPAMRKISENVQIHQQI
jgi:hypothetical protein